MEDRPRHSMRFAVGHRIRNKITGQEAQIVRIADTPRGMAYIVSISLGETWGDSPIETLWQESEIELQGRKRPKK